MKLRVSRFNVITGYQGLSFKVNLLYSFDKLYAEGSCFSFVVQ